METVQRLLQPASTVDEMRVRLKIFLEETIEPFLQHPDLYKIVQMEIAAMHPRCEDVFRETFLKIFETLVEFLSKAKKNRLIKKDLEPSFIAQSFYNQFCHQMLFDKIHKRFHGTSLRDKEYRQEWIEHTINLFLNGIKA